MNKEQPAIIKDGVLTVGTTFSLNGATGAGLYTGSQTWQAHNAMGTQGTVNGSPGYNPGTPSFNILTSKETLTDVTGINYVSNENWWLIFNPNATLFEAFDRSSYFVVNGSHNIDNLYGGYLETDFYGSGTYGQVQQNSVWLYVDATSSANIPLAYGYSVYGPQNDGSVPIGIYYSYYAGDLGTPGLTNPYYSWDDSRGVRRVKEDATFDSVGQAIEALYNPQFTKYTPGAANYERVVLGQWNGNVAEIGTEKGGTGTLRRLRLIGPSVQINAIAVAALPAADAGLAGARTTVSDSNAALTAGIGAVVAGGGASVVPVFCDGAAWRIG